jgi:hypothetical protein
VGVQTNVKPQGRSLCEAGAKNHIKEHWNEFNAMLNARQNKKGGTIFFGIAEEDSGFIVESGIFLSSKDKDTIRGDLGERFSESSPQISNAGHDLKGSWKIDFIEMKNNCYRFNVHIRPSDVVVTVSEKNTTAYDRSGGNSRKISRERLQRLMTDARDTAAAPTITTMLAPPLPTITTMLTVTAIGDLRNLLHGFHKCDFDMEHVLDKLNDEWARLDIQAFEYDVDLVDTVLVVVTALFRRIRYKKTSKNVAVLCKQMLIDSLFEFEKRLSNDQLRDIADLAFELIYNGIKYGIPVDASSILQLGGALYLKLLTILKSRKSTKDGEVLSCVETRFRDLYDLPFTGKDVGYLEIIADMANEDDHEKRFEIEKQLVDINYKWY